ncbi:alpha/beta fold hydrolase [Rheinheimera oceanensis]|uniref:alpha/beta fold hydrolase n=1 Tax=Rheinheimera oceanensis TaxID=2817449 RepID=UPI001BFE5178|nr:alpha/beta hydrolase [Rheinheimera oceanensis]
MQSKTIPAMLLASGMVSGVALADQSNNATKPHVRFNYEQVENVNIFYREVGSKDSPTILMLHGYAASSYMWRDVINALSADYHVIALDLPAFGFTESPAREDYEYTFANLANTVDKFIKQKGINSFAIAVHDYGAPVGWRLALKNPGKVTAIISQNGNAYEDGLADGWGPIKKYWQNPSSENRAALSDFPTAASIKWQYVEGVPDLTKVSPDGYTLEGLHVSKPGMADIQLDLLLDYKSNVEQYPQYQAYFRQYQPPLLAVWGKNDPFFSPEGAQAWKRDIPKAEIHFFDTGHFALETHQSEIIPVIKDFLQRNLK